MDLFLFFINFKHRFTSIASFFSSDVVSTSSESISIRSFMEFKYHKQFRDSLFIIF